MGQLFGEVVASCPRTWIALYLLSKNYPQNFCMAKNFCFAVFIFRLLHQKKITKVCVKLS